MPSLNLGICILKMNPENCTESNPIKLSSGIFNSQVPGGMDVNENMVEGGGELELVEGGAEK